MRGSIRSMLFAGLALLVGMGCVEAQTTAPPAAFGPSPAKPPRPAPSFGAPPGEPSAFAPPQAALLRAPGPFGAIFSWVVNTQQSMQRELATGVKNLKSGNAMVGAMVLAALSFVYGVAHAVGPGHGKAIISSYVIANEETVRRGVIISFIAAGLQALTAIALVGVLAIALNASGLAIKSWTLQLESISYALIALVGLWLLTMQLIPIFRRWREARPGGRDFRESAAEAQAHHNHGQDHHDEHEHHHDGEHDRAHAHHHAEGETCHHIVDAQALAGPFSWSKIMAVVFSVGVRPCSGAILVLVFALTQGLFWAGVAATFAMAFGTALTVAALATLALGSRELALKLGGGSGAWANAVWSICAIGGSILILMFGAILFAASLGPARPF
jgi:nickel/cobalt transporter (NicO) family protein